MNPISPYCTLFFYDYYACPGLGGGAFWTPAIALLATYATRPFSTSTISCSSSLSIYNFFSSTGGLITFFAYNWHFYLSSFYSISRNSCSPTPILIDSTYAVVIVSLSIDEKSCALHLLITLSFVTTMILTVHSSWLLFLSIKY